MINISNQLSGIINDQREKIPVAFVMVWDTTNTVPSNGFFVSYYSGLDTSLSGSLKRTQFEPIIMKDWQGGIPVELSKYINTYTTNSGVTLSDPYIISYSGYFWASESGLYNFGARTNGITSIYLDDNQILTGTKLSSPGFYNNAQSLWPGRPYYWNDSVTLNTGWHNYRLDFKWLGITSGDVTSPFLTAFYKNPSSVNESILSASVINYQPSFIQPVVLGNVMKVDESVDNELAGQYDFEVSARPSGDYAWNRSIEDFGNLKINRLCSIHMGYVTVSGYDYTSGYTTNLDSCPDLIKKFTGMIDKVSINHTKDSLTATVSCRDFKKKLINAINENYPNRSHYTQAILSKVDSNKKFDIDHLMPSTFDAWNVFDVISAISLSAGIDPIKLNQDKWDMQNHFVMESNLNWPLTTTVDVNGIETKDGDPYIHKLEYGEILNDSIQKTVDLIGYNLYFDRYGDMVVKEPRRTNRVEVYETGVYGSKSLTLSGNWNVNVDINASNRLYISPTSINTARFTFSGVGFGIYQILYPSGPQYSVEIIDSQNQTVFNGLYSTNSGLQYGNLNSVTRDLPLGQYDAYIKASGAIRIEGLEYYTQNIFKPTYILRDNVDISTIDLDIDDYTLRNEVIAVGQQISDKGYLYSKAIDIDSISNPNAFNYVGEKRTFTLIEPTIQSQKRLDWLSSNILNRFRRKQRNINVVCQGLPHLEINDPVGIISRKLSLNSSSSSGYDANNNEIYYINKISSNLTKADYKTTLSLTSLKPIESWRPPLSITTDILKKIYEANDNTIFSNFTQDTLNSNYGYGYDGFSEQAAFVSFDLLIDVDRLWVLIADELDGGAIFKNIDVNSKNPIITYQVANNQDPNNPPKGAVWLHNGGSEKWGRITVPTSNNNFDGGQWIGQNSESKVRLSGTYPIAIWAQFRTSDNSIVVQGIWVPTSGTLDNRNRTQAWSSTSEFNTYIAYNSNVNGTTLQTPINPSLKLGFLPSFTIKNSPMTLDLWLGPQESGYQMVSNNKLINMSGNFTYHGNLWNSTVSESYPAQIYDPSYQSTPFNIVNKTKSIVTTILPNQTSISSVDVPWAGGSGILFNGEIPSNRDIINSLYEIYKVGGTKTHSDFMNIFGPTPQGIDYINLNATGYRSYVSTPKETSTENSRNISGAVETINHYGNYFTLKPVRDVYLTYIAKRPKFIWSVQPTYNTAGYGRIEVSEINPITIGPFKSNVAIYLGPGENGLYLEQFGFSYLNDGPIWGLYNPRDSSDYYKFKSAGNVLNSDNKSQTALIFARSQNSATVLFDVIYHYFQIIDAKTNEKSYFSFKTNVEYTYSPFGNSYSLSESPPSPRNAKRPMTFTQLNVANGITVREYPRIL